MNMKDRIRAWWRLQRWRMKVSGDRWFKGWVMHVDQETGEIVAEGWGWLRMRVIRDRCRIRRYGMACGMQDKWVRGVKCSAFWNGQRLTASREGC